MNARSYKLILILLSCCVLFILGLQGYWLRSFYIQKTETFNRTIYSLLEKISDKLQERKTLQALKMTYIIVDGDTIAKTPSKQLRFGSDSNMTIVNSNTAYVSTRNVQVTKNTRKEKDSVLINGKNESVNIVMKGSKGKKPRIIVFDKNKPSQKEELDVGVKTYKVLHKNNTVNEEAEGMTKLLDKMITEIKIIDTETENVDSLTGLIKRALQSQGVFLPFEFSMQKNSENKKEILAQSKGYSPTQKSYVNDLSSNKVIPTHEFLFLQFPGKKDFVMAGMKGSVILSVIFSLLIISVFYYVLRLILRQKKLSEMKTDFVNNMTHELKTPIATISLALDALSNPLVKNDEEKFIDYTRILKEENQKLNKHVESVLQIAQLDKGKLHLNKEPVNLVEMIKAVLTSFSLQIAEQKAKIYFDPSPEKIFMSGDAQHLRTIIGNLLDNALKYSGAECVIEIAIKKAANVSTIRIKDNGIGIDASQNEKVFEKFYRVQGGNLHDVKGFGLGLSYVKSVIEAHGGTIELKSELGKGSEFVIRFEET